MPAPRTVDPIALMHRSLVRSITAGSTSSKRVSHTKRASWSAMLMWSVPRRSVQITQARSPDERQRRRSRFRVGDVWPGLFGEIEDHAAATAGVARQRERRGEVREPEDPRDRLVHRRDHRRQPGIESIERGDVRARFRRRRLKPRTLSMPAVSSAEGIEQGAPERCRTPPARPRATGTPPAAPLAAPATASRPAGSERRRRWP